MSSSSPIKKYKYGDLTTKFDDATKMMTVNWKMKEIQEFIASPINSIYWTTSFKSERDTKWYMFVKPNGMNDDNAGDCKLGLNLKSMPESYGKVMVYWNMRCNETGASRQDMKIYDKPTGFGWTNRSQLLSELSTLNQISFSCIFRILRIEDKDGNPIYEYPLRISSIPRTERFTWNIDEELALKMATATVGKRFAADGILSSSGLFSISLNPNVCSGDTESEGEIKVYLKLCALPIGITALTVKYKIIAPELGEVRSFTKTLNYDSQSWGGAMGQFQYLDAIKTMKFMAETEILEVFDTNGTKMENVQFKEDGMYYVLAMSRVFDFKPFAIFCDSAQSLQCV